uniref:Uncharacterized protein n=1 Tax=Populus trichocarpa TaxID=3694 RepID=A0A2K2B902_POPTR
MVFAGNLSCLSVGIMLVSLKQCLYETVKSFQQKDLNLHDRYANFNEGNPPDMMLTPCIIRR